METLSIKLTVSDSKMLDSLQKKFGTISPSQTLLKAVETCIKQIPLLTAECADLICKYDDLYTIVSSIAYSHYKMKKHKQELLEMLDFLESLDSPDSGFCHPSAEQMEDFIII